MTCKRFLRSLTALAACAALSLPAGSLLGTLADGAQTTIAFSYDPIYRNAVTDVILVTDAAWTEDMSTTYYEAIQQPTSYPSNDPPTPAYISEAVRRCIRINGQLIGDVNTSGLPNKIQVRMEKHYTGNQRFYIMIYDGYLDKPAAKGHDFTVEILEGMVDMQNRPIQPISMKWIASEGKWVDYTLTDAAKETIRKIEAIGDVGRDSLPLIAAAENAYAELTELEKSMVHNYDILRKARQDYERIDKLQGLPAASFDEEHVVLTFGAVSDTHNNNNHIPKALNILKERAAGKLDALVIAGDIADQPVYGHSFEELPVVKQTFENYVEDTVPIFFCLGNHDSSAGSNAQKYYDALGPRFYMADLDQETARETGNRHALIGGYHFLAVEADYSKMDYTEETLVWAKKTLESITSASDYNGEPIFIVTHISSKNTVRGCTGSTGLANILKDYPQAIALTGHSHNSIHDERAIMQTDFTTVNLGSVNFLALEMDYLESLADSLVDNSYDLFTGTLIEVDAAGNVRITRLDFANDTCIREPWIIPAPAADNSHLLYYTGARGTILNESPAFSPDAKAEAMLSSLESEKDLLELRIDAAADDELVYCYQIDLFEADADKPAKTYRTTTGFYNYSADTMPEVHTAVLPGLSEKPYRLEIRAVDAWEKMSPPIGLTIDDSTAVVAGLPGNKTPTRLTAFNPPYYHEAYHKTEFLVLTDADWTEELGDSYFDAIQNPDFTGNAIPTPAYITEAVNRFVRINGKTLAEINTAAAPNKVTVQMQRFAATNKQMFSFLVEDGAIDGVSVNDSFTLEFLEGMVDMGNTPIRPVSRRWMPSLKQWMEAHVHSWGDWSDDGESGHSRLCAICGDKETQPHEGGAADCKHQAVCTVCGAAYGAFGAHSWDEKFTVDQAPGCTSPGSQSRHCKRCDATTDVTVIDALGHDYQDGICVVCGAEEPDSPPAAEPDSPPAAEPDFPPAVEPDSPPAVEPDSPPAVEPDSPPVIPPTGNTRTAPLAAMTLTLSGALAAASAVKRRKATRGSRP